MPRPLFAPGGQTIVYAAGWDGAQKPALFSVRTESPESLRLALSEGDVESVSRTGEMLVLNLPRRPLTYSELSERFFSPGNGLGDLCEVDLASLGLLR